MDEIHPGSQILSTDPKLLHGKLDNGFEYLIRSNQKPKDRAHFQLVVKAGSLLEEEDQRGLAHILEHMAFNGSTNFKSGDLIEYFTSIGMRFGAHLNAMTSFEKTIYKLQVPTKEFKIMEQTFAVMRDWGSELLFLPNEIERERKVGLEEWRQGLSGMRRAFEQLMPTTFHGSIHTERLPIGTEDSLRNFSHDALKRFYQDWYRPDLTGLIIVGDVNPTEMEEMIRRFFSDWKGPEIRKELPSFPLQQHDEPFYAVACDAELPYPSVSILKKRPVVQAQTVEQYRQCYILPELIDNAINERLEFLTRRNDVELQFASAGSQRLTSSWCADSIRATMSEEDLEGGVKRLIQEVKRIQEYGITTQELARAKKKYISSIEMAYVEQENTPSRYFIDEMIRCFTNQEIICGIDTERGLANQFIDTINIDEINHHLQNWLTGTGKVIQLVCTEATRPSETELKRWVEQAYALAVEPPAEEAAPRSLLIELPESGTIVHSEYDKQFDVTQWTLDNGARVWLKPTDFQADRVVFGAVGKGGNSLASDEDLIAAKTSNELAYYSGCNGLNSEDIERVMAGVQGKVDFHIARHSQQMRGFGFREDLETLLQYFWVRTQCSQFDARMLQRVKEWHHTHLVNQLANPQVVYRHQFIKMLWQDNSRHQPMQIAHLQRLDLEKSKAFFNQVFGPSSDMTYVFVGPFDIEELKGLINQYIGGLPPSESREAIDRGDRLYSGHHQQQMEIGADPKGHYRFHTVCRGQFEREQRFSINYLSQILQERLRKDLREKRGAIYSVSAIGKYSHFPEESISLEIDFSCDPERVKELQKATIEHLHRLLNEGPEEKEVAKVSKQILSSHEEYQRDDIYWLSRFLELVRRGKNLGDLVDAVELVALMNPKLLHHNFTTIIDLKNSIELIQVPALDA